MKPFFCLFICSFSAMSQAQECPKSLIVNEITIEKYIDRYQPYIDKTQNITAEQMELIPVSLVLNHVETAALNELGDAQGIRCLYEASPMPEISATVAIYTSPYEYMLFRLEKTFPQGTVDGRGRPLMQGWLTTVYKMPGVRHFCDLTEQSDNNASLYALYTANPQYATDFISFAGAAKPTSVTAVCNNKNFDVRLYNVN